MKQAFKLHRSTRENALKLSEAFNPEQLNLIPAGFNNNLIWNLGHMVITQQLLLYKMSGNELRVDKSLVNKYKKGSKPEAYIEETEIKHIQELLISTSEQAKQDFEAGLFKEYKHYSTSYGFELLGIEDSVAFNNVHEAMHLGNLLSMRKFIPI